MKKKKGEKKKIAALVITPTAPSQGLPFDFTDIFKQNQNLI